MGMIIKIDKPQAEKPKAVTKSKSARKLREVDTEKVSASATTQYIHGPGGLLVTPGVDPSLISMVQRPRGLSSRLRLSGSRFVNPLYEAITGAGDASGNEPSDTCSEPPKVGAFKAGTLTAPFGRVKRRIDTVTLNKLGRLVNNAEPTNLRLANTPAETSLLIPDPARNSDYASTTLGMQYYMLGLEFEKKLERMIFQGNGSYQGLASREAAGYSEFFGLDSLINTGKTDAVTGMANAAFDSQIVSWGSNLIDSAVSIQGKTVDIVDLFSYMVRNLETRSLDTGLGPLALAIVMHRDKFWELTAIWPCKYNAAGCAITDTSTDRLIVATGDQQVQFRDAMRQGEYLMINGRRYPVILSDGMARTAHAGGVKDDIYFLPMQAGPVTGLYLEYFDFSNAEIAEIQSMVPAGTYSVSNGGLYLWTYEKTSFCIYLEAMCEPRLVLRLPHLAGRITNVVSKTILPVSDAYSDSLYPPVNAGFSTGTFGTSNFYIYPNNV